MDTTRAILGRESPFVILNNTQEVDLSRIHILPRGDKLLLMDHRSGKWVYLPIAYEGAVRLLNMHSIEGLSPHVREMLINLRKLLVKQGIGTGTKRNFDAFNTLILKITKACNIACAYCYDWEAGDNARQMDSALARAAIAQAVETCTDHLQIIFHGGEPTLAWGLIEELSLLAWRLARQRGIRLRLMGQTNLTRLNDRIVAFSLENNIEWGISLDGPRQVNDHFRVTHNGKGSYYFFERALARYPEFVRRCGVLSTITSANDGCLLEIARYFRDIGMPSWDWSLFQGTGRGREKNLFTFDIERLLGSWSELFDAVVAGEFDGFPVMPVKKYLDNFLFAPGGNMCMRPECGAARDLLSVSYDGVIEACDCIDPNGPLANLGNLSMNTFAEARQSPTAHRIRSRDLHALACGDCIWLGVCGGTCMAHAGDIQSVWSDGCALSMLAFDRISRSLADDDRLFAYWASCEPK
jgi:uncharacterized protein